MPGSSDAEMPRDQRRDLARKRAGLPLDIDDAQRARPVGLARQPLAEPGIDDLDPLQRVAGARIAPVQPIEHEKLVGLPARSGDRVDRRHAAARMPRQDEAVDRQGAGGVGKPPQGILDQPVDPAIEQRREIVPGVPDPIAARQDREGGPGSAGQVEAAARHLLGERHRAALLRKPVQMDDDVDRPRRKRDLVPAQEQIGLGPGMGRAAPACRRDRPRPAGCSRPRMSIGKSGIAAGRPITPARRGSPWPAPWPGRRAMRRHRGCRCRRRRGRAAGSAAPGRRRGAC